MFPKAVREATSGISSAFIQIEVLSPQINKESPFVTKQAAAELASLAYNKPRPFLACKVKLFKEIKQYCRKNEL